MFKLPELRRLFRLPSKAAPEIRHEVEAEVRFHLEMRVEELEALGRSEAEARREATRRFGDVEATQAVLRSAGGAYESRRQRGERLGDFWRDVVVAVRSFRRHPVFAATAIVMLGLGIGATASVFTVLDRLIFHPLSYPNADRLAVVWQSIRTEGGHEMTFPPDWKAVDAWRANAKTLERMEMFVGEDGALQDPAGLEPIQVSRVSTGLVSMLGGRVVAGRPLTEADGVKGAPRVALLSEGLWRTRYGAEADAIGRPIKIDGLVTVVVGVMGASFDLSPFARRPRPAVWLPLVRGPDGENLHIVARLKPGVSAAIAGGELSRIKPSQRQSDQSTTQAVMGEDLLGRDRVHTFWLIFGAVGLVLLIACANVANLLLIRARVRERELAVRSALGAGRARVARQLLTESGLIGAGGVLLGLALAWWGLRTILVLRPPELTRLDGLHLTWFALAFMAGLALATVALFGLAPIWAAFRSDPGVVLVGTIRHPGRRRAGDRLRGGLVVTELAVSLVLLVGASLLIRSFLQARDQPLGFDADGLGSVMVELPVGRFATPAERSNAMDELVRKARAIPGVAALTVASGSPLSTGVSFGGFAVGDEPLAASASPEAVAYNPIQSDYFAVTGVRLLAGRPISADTGVQEAVVNESTARRFWHGRQALGSRIRLRKDDPGFTVVGIAADVRLLFDGFKDAPFMYVAHRQGDGSSVLLIRAKGAVGPVLREVANVALATLPGVKVRAVQTMQEQMAESLASDRFTALLLAIFAGIAGILAAVGLYGVIAYTVTERTYEIGVRIALGAAPGSVARMVLRDSARLVLLGFALGGIGSVLLSRVIRSQLYQIEPWDPRALLAAAALFALVAAGASVAPAKRAAGVDPLIALRSD